VNAPPAPAWRAFPFDPDAAEGEPYSVGWVPASQAQGRFDLPSAPGGVIYLAETPVHAVAEMVQHYRGQALDDADLRVAGHPLALASLTLPDQVRAGLADLCDPAVLVDLGVRPDATASVSRRKTQRIASEVHVSGYTGLRWWSALRGDWHTIVIFRDRLARELRFGEPEPLTLTHAVVRETMRELGMAG
jgi:hypothetical protein